MTESFCKELWVWERAILWRGVSILQSHFVDRCEYMPELCCGEVWVYDRAILWRGVYKTELFCEELWV